MSILLNPFQLLELNIISAQDLAPASRSMKTYAIAWVHPERRLTTTVDAHGHTNPSWNDKFVFRVDSEFLESDTSAIMIEIYANHWFKDVLLGTVRVLINTVIPTKMTASRFRQKRYIGMEFSALQVRRPSGRPQGILNIGLSVLDSTMRSMPLYTLLSSSVVGYKELVDGSESPDHPIIMTSQNSNPKQQKKKQRRGGARKADYRRSKSDSSSMLSSNNSKAPLKKVSFHEKASSSVNCSDDVCSTLSSVKPESQVGLQAKRLDSALGGITFRQRGHGAKVKPIQKRQGSLAREAQRKLPRDPIAMTDSELGPSPSEVAAQVMAKAKNKPDDVESSILGGAAWSVAESVEGLQSKLERWRTELPPTEDACSEIPSIAPSISPSKVSQGGERRRSKGRRRRGSRRGDGEGEGLFSCFSNICGCQCSITCANPLKKRTGKRGRRGGNHSPGSSTRV